jgi:hypothetical protein
VLSGTLCGGLPMTPLWPSNYGRRMLPGISPLRVPFWREIAESIPMTVATFCPPTTRPAPGCIKHFVIVFVYSDPMEHTPAGLTEKLYWRKARGEWHSFRKLPQVRGYVSLCQRREVSFVHGQQIARPEADLRCSVCDGVEAELRGWTRGSGPASPRRAGSFSR